MLVLGIISFAAELTTLVVASTFISENKLSAGGAWAILFVFIACTVTSIIGLVGNIKNIKTERKGQAITGTVFSGVALVIGSIFLMSFLSGLIAVL